MAKTNTVDELSSITSKNQIWLSWEAEEFAFHDKDWKWTATLIVVALVLLTIFYFQKNWSAMLLVLASGVVLYKNAWQRPGIVKYAVGEEGFSIGSKIYPWSNIKGFWITLSGNHATLYLETTARWMSVITVHLHNIDADSLRQRLIKFLPEHSDRGEHLTDTMSRWFKF